VAATEANMLPFSMQPSRPNQPHPRKAATSPRLPFAAPGCHRWQMMVRFASSMISHLAVGATRPHCILHDHRDR